MEVCSSGDNLELKKPKLFVITLALGALATLSSMSGCSKENALAETDTNILNGVHISEYRRIGFWSGVLQKYPDLPEKVKRIVEEQPSKQYQSDVNGAKVVVHSYVGPISVSAGNISAIITDLDEKSLKNLLAYWQTIPQRARELGIFPNTTRTAQPRVIVLGREGKVEIKGPVGSEIQIVDVYPESLTGQTVFEVHSFGSKGEVAIASLLEHFQRANQKRGPPFADIKAGHHDIPPPEEVPIVIVGKLKELTVEGGAGSSKQVVTFDEYVNACSQTELSKEVVEFAKAGESTFRSKIAPIATAVAAAIAARTAAEARKSSSYTERSSSGGGYRPSGGRRGGARPGR